MINALPEPFFAHVITLSSHHPYTLPKDEITLDLGPLRRTYLGRYFRSVNYVDRAVGRFLKPLRESGVLDRSILIVLGDHDMGRLSGVGDVVHVMDKDADTAFLPRAPSGAEHLGGASAAMDAWLGCVRSRCSSGCGRCSDRRDHDAHGPDTGPCGCAAAPGCERRGP